MLVQSGKIAVLVVVAVILAQTLCPAHLMPAAAGITAAAEQSSCHPSLPSKPLPSKPAAPNSGQKCCVSAHHPESILATRYIPTAPMTVSAVISMPLLALTAASSASSNVPAVISSSPGPLVLRIYPIPRQLFPLKP